MLKIGMKAEPVKRILKRLNRWATVGKKRTLKRTATALAAWYRTNMRAGMEPNRPMTPVTEATMSMPRRWGDGDRIPRRELNSNKSKPINVTGLQLIPYKQNL